MINLGFMAANRKIIRFSVRGRLIIYFDDIWKNGIQIMPMDQNLIERLKRGKSNLKIMAALILDSNKGQNLRDYEACKNEEDLANMIRKECEVKGLMEIV